MAEQPSPAPTTIVGNIAEFGNDIATLAELQLKLAALDAQTCLSAATYPVIALVASAVLAVTALPIFMIGVVFLAAHLFRCDLWIPALVISLVVIVASAVVAWLSYNRTVSSLNIFRRSQEELVRNVSWVRTVLVHSGRSANRNLPRNR